MIKTLIFDFDGTIANTLEASRDILLNLSEKYGYKKFSPEEIEALRDYTIPEIFKKTHVPLFKLPFMIRDVKQQLTPQIAKLKPIKGMKEVLFALQKEGYQLAIITSNNKENVKVFLERNGINVFDAIYTGTSIFGKDRVIQGFLKKYNVHSSNAIYLGDEIRDIEATKKVSIPIIAVTWGFNSKKGLERLHPAHIVDDPKEIMTLLQKISK